MNSANRTTRILGYAGYAYSISVFVAAITIAAQYHLGRLDVASPQKTTPVQEEAKSQVNEKNLETRAPAGIAPARAGVPPKPAAGS